ncbi:hypothetical protein SLS55_008440 [Diplodia seriata]|uniref:Cytochrome P450 n=1 Tax=Diplodia seriata TaxID=420778 RepID=A0ABR3BX84_9PEZI
MLDLAESDLVRHKVRRWHQTYGSIFHTKIGGTDYIWLSSPQTVKDLMDKRSAIYSSRPALPLAQDIASAGRRQLFLPYGPRWRQIRRHGHALLSAPACARYQPIQDAESRQLLAELLGDPAAFYQINRRYAASVIMRATYGRRVARWHDPLIADVFAVVDNLTAMTAPGAHVVDTFPSLAGWPQALLGGWRAFGERVCAHDSEVYMRLWEALKREVDKGEAPECFGKEFYLNDPMQNGIDDLAAAYTCGGLVEAGSETTASSLNTFVLCMTLFPEARQRAQEEIDRVVGMERLPAWGDEVALPYTRALVKEVLRWRPVNKFGMVHASSEDDWYEGFFIPKGSVVVLNWWAIHMDPSIHKDPENFDPARYLGKPLGAAEYLNVSDPYERDHFTYGAGRRVCQGVHMAERSLYINIVRTLWGFNITKKVDSEGKEIEPDQGMVRGFLSVPNPFLTDIKVRSEKHAEVIRKSFEAAEREGMV